MRQRHTVAQTRTINPFFFMTHLSILIKNEQDSQLFIYKLSNHPSQAIVIMPPAMTAVLKAAKPTRGTPKKLNEYAAKPPSQRLQRTSLSLMYPSPQRDNSI